MRIRRALLGACVGAMTVSLLAIAFSTSYEATRLINPDRLKLASIGIYTLIAACVGFVVGAGGGGGGAG
jgi:hypothetical protein